MQQDRGTNGRRGMRRTVAGAVSSALLALALTPVLASVTAAPAAAAAGDTGSTYGAPVYATGGSGLHKDRIAWLSWGALGAQITNNTSVTNWHEVGPAHRVEVTCQLSGRSGDVYVARPGGYSGDGLDDLYNVGGTGTANQLRSAIRTPDGTTRSFRVACTGALVQFNGQGWGQAQRVSSRPVSLGGMVLADAESTHGAEYVQATAAGGTTSPWFQVDRSNGGCATRDNRAQVAVSRPSTTTWAARMSMTSSECTSGTGTPTAVLVANGASALDVQLFGSGVSAVSLGYVLDVDYGDAPASYGVASALLNPTTWSGGNLAAGTTTTAGYSPTPVNCRWEYQWREGWVEVCDTQYVAATGALAAPNPPEVTLGAAALTNRTAPHSANATGDTPDEDAIAGSAAPAADVYGPGSAHSVTVRCRGNSNARVAGWIDWNGSGAFDAGERSAVATCPSTAAAGADVTLTWTVPADVAGRATFLRLRVAADEADLASAVGAALRGEVEDWAMTVRAPRLEVTRTVDAEYVPAAGGALTHTVTVRNVGTLAMTAQRPAYLYDEVADATDDATLGAVSATGGAATVAGSRITWSGPLDVGATATITYAMTVRDAPRDRVMTNLARVSTSPVTATTAVTCDAGSADLAARQCARVQLWAVGIDLVKEVYRVGETTPLPAGARVPLGTQGTRRYTVTNTGSAPLKDVVLTDEWDQSRVVGNGRSQAVTTPRISCPGLAAGTAVVIPRLEPGESIVCTSTGPVMPDR
ncbi:CshA/CshB family fibrillar adhesin-related protein [Cellulomonas sp. NPDC057328]|uniref:CshA/CshB family fibrillar adhesin-related protein n=1 Tax=Cellulomonas sp. NPDC057328 TaxID=3346101 RepID=UPI0036454E12